MRKILVLIDGLGDLDCKQFDGSTPLEEAKMPYLQALAKKSSLGFMYSINEDYAPESDTAVVSILGNNPEISERGEFEAIGFGLKTKRGDLVLRANFGTVENLKSRKILDRRAGRTLTSSEAKILSRAINDNVKLPVKFEFFPTIQHRGILVFYGGFNDNIADVDTYVHEKGKIYVKDSFDWSKSLDEEDENSVFAANLVNSFIDQASKILENHPLNRQRIKKGMMPANIILARDPGVEVPELNKFRNSMAIVNMPLEKGIAKVSGMDVYPVDYPDMKDHDAYANLSKGLEVMSKKSIDLLKKHGKDYNFCYIHIKETDVPGHDNKPVEKKNFLEKLDKLFFKFLTEYCEKNKIKLIVTADHSTPCKFKTHTSDPVPLMLYDPESPGDNLKFGEKNSIRGSLGKIYGKNLLKKTGFV